MTFLNATLIFGVAAAAVPIALHLLAKREPRKVVFPSVRFLVQRFESNRSRLRVRRWWLLALRIAALALLALALARPAIHQSLSLTWLTIGLIAAFGVALLVMASVALARGPSRSVAYGLALASLAALIGATIWGTVTYATGPTPSIETSEPVAIAIVMDNSPTTAWRTADDDRITRIKEIATWMVTRLPRTSRIAVVDRSNQVTSFSLDASSAMAKINQLEPLQVTQPIATRLEAAARLVRTSDLPNRQILLITDLTLSTWNSSEQAGLATILTEDPAISLTVFDLGEFDGMNRALSMPEIADATPPKGVPIALTTTLSLTNSDSGSDASVTAELEMFENNPALPVIRDGVIVRPNVRRVDRASVRVASGGSSQVLLTIPSLPVGTHHGRISLVGSDAMPLDDQRYLTVQVLPPSQILLVGDDEDEARVISQAISANAVMLDDANAEFQVERIGYSDMSVVRLSDFDVLVMLNPPGPTLKDESVFRYLAQGGGVLVCLGPELGEQAVESSYLPKLIRRWRIPEPGTFFQVAPTKHPITEPISNDTPWGSFRVQQYWQLDPEPNDSVLIRYVGNQHPALIERSFSTDNGDMSGRLLVLSTPLPALSDQTRSWNQLFGSDPWPAWLLLRQSIEYLAGRGDNDLMPIVGQSLSLPLNKGTDVVPQSGDSPTPSGVITGGVITDGAVPGEAASGESRQRVQWFPPGDGSPVPLETAADAARLTIGTIQRSGTHWLRGAQEGAGFSANLADQSISLKRIDPAELDAIFGPQQYQLATNLEEIRFAENQTTQRISLHSPAMLLALAVFVLEQILGNRFYQGRIRTNLAAGSA